MAADASYCGQLVHDEDRDRYLATLFAPQDKRAALLSLYAFDLETAHVAARVTEPMAGEVRLQWWHDIIAASASERADSGPVGTALLEAIDRHGLPNAPLLGLIEARRGALYHNAFHSIEEMEAHQAETQGAIFETAARILAGESNPAVENLSRHAGIAFGLTYHLSALFAASGSQPEGDATYNEIRMLAKSHLDSARALLDFVPSQAFPAFLVLALSRPTLARMEQAPARPFTPIANWRRQWILWRAAKNLPKRI